MREREQEGMAVVGGQGLDRFLKRERIERRKILGLGPDLDTGPIPIPGS